MGNFLNKYFNEFKEHTDEKFKFITYPGFDENSFVISNYGKVINFKTGKLRKANMRGKYLIISIRASNKSDKKQSFLIHRLVCWEYCKHKEGCNVVNHIDGNKLNNYYKNLEWVTQQINIRHVLDTGLFIVKPRTFSNELVEDICQLFMQGKNVYEIYKLYYPNDINKNDHINFYNMLLNIRNKKIRTKITSKYNFPESCKRWAIYDLYSKKEVKTMIRYINKGYKNTEILKILGFNDTNMYTKEANKYRAKIDRLRNKLSMNNKNIDN